MNRNTVIGLIAIGIIVVILALLFTSDDVSKQPAAGSSRESIVGCYEATLGKDVYRLTIDAEHNGEVFGRLSFKNYEKDSSNGSFVGSFITNEVLIADYTFSSEGVDSIRQVAFKQVGTGFVEGFGEIETINNQEFFKNPAALSYDNSFTFVKGACTQ